MNIQLRNDLAVAHNYFQYINDNFTEKISKSRVAITSFENAFSRKPFPKTPEMQMNEQSIKDILLLIFLWPVGLMNMSKNKKNRAERELQANKQFVEEMNKYEEFCDEVANCINHALAQIKELEIARQEFEYKNCGCTLFIPEAYRSLWHVSRLYGYVNNGRADSLKEAINLLEADIQHEEDMEKIQNMFEMEQAAKERHHKETMASLNEIQRLKREAIEQRRQMQSTMSNIYTEMRR